jgi:hypothetical protein
LNALNLTGRTGLRTLNAALEADLGRFIIDLIHTLIA